MFIKIRFFEPCYFKIMFKVLLVFLTLFFTSCGEKLKKGSANISSDQLSGPVMPKPNQWLGHFGSHRNGISAETNLNLDWFNAEPKRLWKFEIGTGVSGVSAINDTLFSMGNNKGSDTVYCLDAVSGEIIWEYSYRCPLDKRMFEGGPAVTPLIDVKNDQLYTLSHDGNLNCLDIKSGKQKWSLSYVSKVLNGKRPTYGFACSPILYNDDLIISAGGDGSSIASVSPIDGSLNWSCGNGTVGYSSPIIFNLGGVDRIAQFNASKLCLYDPEGKKQVAVVDWRTKYSINAAIPIYSNGHILVSSGYGKGGALFKINDKKFDLVYETKDLLCQFQSPILIDGYVYAVSGDNDSKAKLICMNLNDGKIMWSESFGGNRGNVIYAEGALIVLTERGEVISCKASPESFEEMGRFQAVGGRCWAPPTICNSRLMIRNNAGRLVCYNLKKG